MTERGLKNINVFYSTFTNVFFTFATFLRFLTFFIFFWNVFFTYMDHDVQLYPQVPPTSPVGHRHQQHVC